MTNILGVGGNRLVWRDLPDHVRVGIEELLGAPVIQATSEPGGFSPGLAFQRAQGEVAVDWLASRLGWTQ